jgi:hypothetical protein
MDIVSTSRVYDAVNQCIYCGDSVGKLGNEHIIPAGLAGDTLVLPKSSCQSCSTKTGRTEQINLRHVWWPIRTQLGLPSRSVKPQSFLLKMMRVDEYDRKNDWITKYTKLGELEKSPADFPRFLLTYDFPPPGILSSRATSFNVAYETCLFIDKDEMHEHADQNKMGFLISPGRPEQFCRMLAKIAYGFAIAELGIASFDCPLTNYILGGAIDRLQWIGSNPKDATPIQGRLHELELFCILGGKGTILVCDVWLFAFLGAPRFRVVLGTTGTQIYPTRKFQVNYVNGPDGFREPPIRTTQFESWGE